MVGSAGCEGKPAPAAAMPAEVTVCQPLQRQITDAVEYTGTTSAPESADVRARVTGFLEKVLFEPRARVNAGDPIFEIDARPFKAALERAEADVKANEAQLVKAEFDAERIIELQEKGVASPSEFTKEIANRDMVRASLAASKAIAEQAALEYSWCKVTAPITGRISRNYIDTGNIVTADQTVLARITNDDSLFAYFNCSERDVLTLREWARKEYVGDGGSPTSMPEIRQVKWPMYLGLMTEEGFPHVGVMDYTSPEVDASTGTLQVRGVFPNSNNILIPGLFVRLRLPIGKPYPATVVPERVLGSDQGQRYLFVVNAKNVVEYRPVAVGTLDAGLRVITQGISDSDWVIVSGMQRVRPGASVNAQRVPMESVLKPGTAGTAATTQTAERIESRGDTQL
ncbi:MAG TPA: efflux RND transporter periplasmic adaptor subunit [Phycisphaerae bacterium]|nr:efflux RND transporter periplasmic adaptor subunit [Phycisphaerae bacterium]